MQPTNKQVEIAPAEHDALDEVLMSLGFSPTTVERIRASYATDHIHRHLRQTLWLVSVGKVANPTGWMIASMRENFSEPFGYPAELAARSMTIQLDESTFAEVEKIVGEKEPRNAVITEFRRRMLASGGRV